MRIGKWTIELDESMPMVEITASGDSGMGIIYKATEPGGKTWQLVFQESTGGIGDGWYAFNADGEDLFPIDVWDFFECKEPGFCNRRHA